MTELCAKVIQKVVAEQIESNSNVIEKFIFNGTNEDMSSEEIYSHMILNSVSLAVNMSVQIVTEMLLNSGTIEIADEEHLRKLLLSVVND